MAVYKSLLHQMVSETETEFWNDSCAVSELKYAIEHGASGATTNPVIVGGVLKQEMDLWKERINQIINENPAFSEIDVAWQLNEEMALKGAEMLMPVFRESGGRKGRISIQTNAQYYRDTAKMVEQAVRFDRLAPNMQVKMPATKAGIAAIEEATYRGVNINATVSFTVAQSIAVAEAVERGLKRREAEGRDTSGMIPVCTLMVGRTDDWLKAVEAKKGFLEDPGYLEWAGVACFKKSCEIFSKRGYRTRMLAAAYRNILQCTEFIGGNVVLTIPSGWQKKINNCGAGFERKMDRPVNPAIVEALYGKFAEFRKAYDEDGLKIEEFDSYGAVARTLRQFLAGYSDLLAVIRDFMVKNPDTGI